MISALYTPGGVNPPLDGITPVFMLTGADPSLAPGLDLPPGSISRFGADYYWKFGLDPTDWAVNPFSTGGGGGITNVTGSSGIHVTGSSTKNVTNDLVTGDPVAVINAQSNGTATILAASHLTLQTAGAGDILATAARDESHTVGRAFTLTAAGAAGITITTTHASSGAIDVSTVSGDINLTAGDDGKITANAAGDATFKSTGGAMLLQTQGSASLQIDAAAALDINAGASSTIDVAGDLAIVLSGTGGLLLDTKGTGAAAANSIVVVSDEDFNVTADDDVVVNAGDRITILATNLLTLGGDGITLSSTSALTATGGPMQFNVTGGADFEIAYAAGGFFKIFGGVGQAQQSDLGLITGGTVQDSEVRTWLAALRTALQNWGWMET